MLFYDIVYFFLLLEMVLFTILIVPVPLAVRRPMLLWLSKSPAVAKARYWLMIFLVPVVIMFVDSVMKARKKADEEGHHHHSIHDPYSRAGKFYEQRNMYLTGAVLFLSLVLNRFIAMVTELMSNESKAEVLKQQAAKQSKEYMRLLDKEHSKDSEMDSMKAQLAEAQKQVKDLEVVKRQAKQTHDEYMRLTDRMVELEKKQGGSDARKDR
ncbi:B-cell receptor-associated protein 31-like-domain-containing protein [Phlyctochytrium arcticum]|nr:B-cell receptor-associated protein 31-like-domain-containing protein [Phlyctochytrium arcticum]